MNWHFTLEIRSAISGGPPPSMRIGPLYRKPSPLSLAHSRFDSSALSPFGFGGSPRWFRAPAGDYAPARVDAALPQAQLPCPIRLVPIRIPPPHAPDDSPSTYPCRIPPREVAASGRTLKWRCCLR